MSLLKKFNPDLRIVRGSTDDSDFDTSIGWYPLIRPPAGGLIRISELYI
jgi:hypothetical protein